MNLSAEDRRLLSEHKNDFLEFVLEKTDFTGLDIPSLDTATRLFLCCQNGYIHVRDEHPT